MKRRIIIFVCAGLTLLCSEQAISQVWNGNLVFRSQAEIDDFANFSYTSVNGDLQISDALDGQHDIRNLAGLAGLTAVTGFLDINNNNLLVNTAFLNLTHINFARISNNPALTEINGLAVTSMPGGLTIENNASLTRITAFSPLTAIGGQLYIQLNPLLTNVSGFINLRTVTGSLIIGNNNSLTNLNSFAALIESKVLIIRNNPSLTNINGLSNLTRVVQFEIVNNPLLASLDGLSSLDSVGLQLEIAQNPLLTNLAALSGLSVSNPFTLSIHHNNGLQGINIAANIGRIGTIRIEENPALTSISGFANLTYAVNIEIIGNRALETISGFGLLDTVYSNLNLTQNNNLTTINAFSKLAFIGGNFTNVNNYILTNIAPMPLLDSVGGDLSVVLDTTLTSLNYLSKLRGVGRRFILAANYWLENISGLSSLRAVKGDLRIASLPKITSLSALSHISAVGGSMIIESMSGLESLAGLRHIYKVGLDLHITGIPKITTLNDLTGIDSVGRDVVITRNLLLKDLNGLHFLRHAQLIYIQDNPQLDEFCGLYGFYVNGGPPLGTIITLNLVNPTPQQIRDAGPCLVVSLPVVLKLFNCRCEHGKVVVNWITTDEYNNSHFIVQRSGDGVGWINLSSMAAAGGNGVEHKYNFTDEQPLSNGYYRLAQFDRDGQVHYSSVVRASCAMQSEVRLWPNPATDKIFITIQSANAAAGFMRLYDSKGALVKSKNITFLSGANRIELFVGDMLPGMYVVHISNGGRMMRSIIVISRSD